MKFAGYLVGILLLIAGISFVVTGRGTPAGVRDEIAAQRLSQSTDEFYKHDAEHADKLRQAEIIGAMQYCTGTIVISIAGLAFTATPKNEKRRQT